MGIAVIVLVDNDRTGEVDTQLTFEPRLEANVQPTTAQAIALGWLQASADAGKVVPGSEQVKG